MHPRGTKTIAKWAKLPPNMGSLDHSICPSPPSFNPEREKGSVFFCVCVRSVVGFARLCTLCQRLVCTEILTVKKDDSLPARPQYQPTWSSSFTLSYFFYYATATLWHILNWSQTRASGKRDHTDKRNHILLVQNSLYTPSLNTRNVRIMLFCQRSLYLVYNEEF